MDSLNLLQWKISINGQPLGKYLPSPLIPTDYKYFYEYVSHLVFCNNNCIVKNPLSSALVQNWSPLSRKKNYKTWKNLVSFMQSQRKKEKKNNSGRLQTLANTQHTICIWLKSCRTCCMRDTTPMLGGMFFWVWAMAMTAWGPRVETLLPSISRTWSPACSPARWALLPSSTDRM